MKGIEIGYSENGRDVYKRVDWDNIPTFASGGIPEPQGEYGSEFLFGTNEKYTMSFALSQESYGKLMKAIGVKHRSRKWKKKRGLLLRQRRRKVVALRKALQKYTQKCKTRTLTFNGINVELRIKTEVLNGETKN